MSVFGLDLGSGFNVRVRVILRFMVMVNTDDDEVE